MLGDGLPQRSAIDHRTSFRIARVALALFVLVSVIVDSAPILLDRRVAQLAGPYTWSAVDWEVQHLGDGVQEIRDQLFNSPSDDRVLAEVRAYLTGEISLENTGVAELRGLLAAAVAMQLREDGAPVLGRLVAPPVTLSLTRALRLLVVSPRNEIRQASFALLEGDFRMDRAPELERAVDAHNVSALVVEQIAIATYPTLIPLDTPPSAALQTVAHEWTHIALFFAPLGQAYGTSPQARNINETTADVVGEEIGNALMRRAGIEPPRSSSGGRASPFAERMRAIRQRVDEFLAGGQVEEAEAYMEAQRLALVTDGYRIRRLNQAYFAFFGNYAEGPAASTEVPDGVRAIRAQSETLAEFLARIGRITSTAELRAAVGASSP